MAEDWICELKDLENKVSFFFNACAQATIYTFLPVYFDIIERTLLKSSKKLNAIFSLWLTSWVILGQFL